MKNIWDDLQKPIFALAPMEDVTDTVFRQVVDKYAPADIYFTEFTSTEALLSPKEKESAMQRLRLTSRERPLIAQIWGTDPKLFAKSAKIITELGFDGIDINMGCPVKDIVKTGACSALINSPKLASELVHSLKESTDLPISVKTRLGTHKIITEEWIGFLLEQNLSCLTVHGRTAKEMSKPPVHWEEIAKAVTLKNQISPQTVLLGNGDILSYADGLAKTTEYGLDGVMIGRGIFQNLLIFDKEKDFKEFSLSEKLEVMRFHIELFEKTWGDTKNYNILKKFYKIYVNGFPGASDMRVRFMETKTSSEALALLHDV